MNERFYESIAGFSDKEKKVITEIADNDRGFHSLAFAAEIPFYGMLEQDEDGYTSVADGVSVPIGGDGVDFTIRLERSNENQCWFFSLEFGEDRFDGIIQFNSVYNAKGMYSFAFVNDNDGSTFDDITKSLPYTTFFAMVK